MLDTNQVAQVVQDASTIHAVISPHMAALAVAAGWAGRELRNFNAWLLGICEYIVSHGGIGMIVLKLLWNPAGLKLLANNPPIQQSNNPTIPPAAS